jgi:hypothetical protein
MHRAARPPHPAGSLAHPSRWTRRTPQALPSEPARIRISSVDFAASAGVPAAPFAAPAPSRRFRSAWPMPIALHSRRLRQLRPRRCHLDATKVTAARDPHPPDGRDRDEDRDGPRVREHGDAASLLRDGGSDSRASWSPRKAPSSSRSHRDPGEGPRAAPPPPGAGVSRVSIRRRPGRRLRVSHQGGGRETPVASPWRWPGLIRGAGAVPANRESTRPCATRFDRMLNEYNILGLPSRCRSANTSPENGG